MTTTPSYRRARHSVSLLHAHVVFVTKYRRPVFTDAMLTHCENIMRDACTELGTELVEFKPALRHYERPKPDSTPACASTPGPPTTTCATTAPCSGI
ncbi:hypothetical protein C0J29_32215 (plasmid) [Mycobacterium paragordonae]|uniref:Transposase IS200-like domain-containing protein n=1 Tax=Mycobacterium paragordonae TaxID=1389713 RepID=A0ABQ1CFB9_9MYCO|nr:hypothetical protein C0J29_32215 [Mycobacterium paragordonae]QNI15284.1 hypothetical protein GAN18_29360 [Mycobacterium kubicae]GFG83145.1 hypothetical protein MPRG_64210 [Mycobacterium paragordonae]